MAESTRTPNPNRNGSAPVHGAPNLGPWLDETNRIRTRASELSDDAFGSAVDLVARELRDRADAIDAESKPGLLVVGFRKLFSRGHRTAKPLPRIAPQPAVEAKHERARVPGWMLWLGVWLDRTVGSLPLLAPLAISGWYTSHAGYYMLALPWAVAVLLSVALEGGVWRLARLLEKTLVAGDTTVSIRLGIAGYLTLIGGLILAYEVTSQVGWSALMTADGWSHVNWVRTWPAIVASCLSVAGVYIWSKVARWQRREELRAQGRIDAQLIRFSFWRWVLCPIETPKVVRYAVKHSIERPEDALAAFRLAKADREFKRASEKQDRAENKAAKKTANPNPNPQPEPAPAATRRESKPAAANPNAEPTKPAPVNPNPAEATTKPNPKPNSKPSPAAEPSNPTPAAVKPNPLPRIGASEREMARAVRDAVVKFSEAHGRLPGQHKVREWLAPQGYQVGLKKAGAVAELAATLPPAEQSA